MEREDGERTVRTSASGHRPSEAARVTDDQSSLSSAARRPVEIAEPRWQDRARACADHLERGRRPIELDHQRVGEAARPAALGRLPGAARRRWRALPGRIDRALPSIPGAHRALPSIPGAPLPSPSRRPRGDGSTSFRRLPPPPALSSAALLGQTPRSCTQPAYLSSRPRQTDAAVRGSSRHRAARSLLVAGFVGRFARVPLVAGRGARVVVTRRLGPRR